MTWFIILGWLNKARTAFTGFVGRYPWQAAVIALSVAFLWTLHGKHAAQAEVAAMKAASKQATAAQIAVNHEPAAKSQAIAEKSNAEAPAYYRAVHAAADANRVSNPCVASPANLPGANPSVESVHGPALAPGMVSRPKADDDQLVEAASRAAKMHQEALDLIDAGVAIAGE
jgi:hypothetical protein